jgi:restriction system protein
MSESAAPLTRREVAERAALTLALTPAQKEVRIPSGRHLVYRHRAGWALNLLKNAGLAESPARNSWVITEAGRRYLSEHPDELSSAEVTELQKLAKSSDEKPDEMADVSLDDERTPLEQIEGGLEALRRVVAEEILARLAQADPGFFEQVVLDVLHGMGYGANREALQQTGQSGDGGIDGIISLDRLGLEKVYVQAKRWQSTVGRPVVQGFFGAVSGHRATKGVLITTSTFTREARDYAATVSDSLALINGQQLAQLMIEAGVGVSLRSLYIPDIDSDYFTDE